MMTREEKRAFQIKNRKKKKKDKKIPYEETLGPEARKAWDGCREDYEIFRQDALIPMANGVYTLYSKIYDVYVMYCKAAGLPVRISNQKLGILLRENFKFNKKDAFKYGLKIRPNLFIKVENEIEISEG